MTEQIAPPLPLTRRVVTGHSDAGTAVLKEDSAILSTFTGDGALETPLWRSEEHPADVNVTSSRTPDQNIIQLNGSLASTYDVLPRSSGIFHRTKTLDYVVVLRGSLTLGLGDADSVDLREGDVVIQQSTLHNWRSSSDQWARLFGVMIPAQSAGGTGTELGTSWSDLSDISSYGSAGSAGDCEWSNPEG